MALAFVTGATGFIGNHVVRVLMENGWAVRAIRRVDAIHPSLQIEGVDWRVGDIRNPDSVHPAMKGCDAVFHVAADYRLWCRHPREIYESNVQGTINVLEAASRCGVDRVVYTSSVGALGLNDDGSPSDESTPVGLDDMIGHYKRSKFLAEREAEKFCRLGLPVVIVNPSTPVGPGDHKPTPTGKIILDFLNGRMPAYLDTGLNLIHVRDVAVGHLLAFEKGRIGEKYILGHRNLTLKDIFQLLHEISGMPAPRFRLPYRPILLLAQLNHGLSMVTGKAPMIPLDGVRMARKHMFFDSAKAVSQLGLPQTPIEEAIEDAVGWFRRNGYVR